MQFKKFLVAVDFSPCARHALEVASQLASSLGASIDVLHAWTAPAYVSPYVAVQLSEDGPAQTLEALARDEAQREMEKFLASFPFPPNVAVSTRIEFGLEADAILKASVGYDLVVVGTHGRSGIAHLFMGSVAERVVRRATTPVLTVRMPHDRSAPGTHA